MFKTRFLNFMTENPIFEIKSIKKANFLLIKLKMVI